MARVWGGVVIYFFLLFFFFFPSFFVQSGVRCLRARFL